MDPSSSERAEPARDGPLPVASSTEVAPRPIFAANVIAVVLLGVILALAMLGTPRPGASPADPATLASADSDPASGGPVAPPVFAGAGFVWPTAEPSLSAAGAAQFDVCAAGSPAGEAVDEDAFASRFAAAGRRARERLLGTLEASAEDRLRVLGLVLQRDADVAAAALPMGLLRESCGRDAACVRRAAESLAEASRVAAGPTTEAIARLASASRDALAYGLAVDACTSNMAAVAPSCRLISPEQWARLDPDSAVPWLHVAAAAAGRRDPAALADALHRAAHARSNRVHGAPVHDLLDASLPVDITPSERVQAQAMVASAVASASTLPDYSPAIDFCSRAAVRDSNRAQSCAALTTQLTDNAGTLLDLAVGIRLAEQIGWPDERLEDLRRRHDAYSRVQVEAMAETEPRNCAELGAAAEQGVRLARLGEIGALREAVELSGKTIEQLASEERASRPVRLAEQGAPVGASN